MYVIDLKLGNYALAVKKQYKTSGGELLFLQVATFLIMYLTVLPQYSRSSEPTVKQADDCKRENFCFGCSSVWSYFAAVKAAPGCFSTCLKAMSIDAPRSSDRWRFNIFMLLNFLVCGQSPLARLKTATTYRSNNVRALKVTHREDRDAAQRALSSHLNLCEKG